MSEGSAALAAAAVLLAVAPASVAGQETGPLDQGAYRLIVDGRVVGTETFEIREEGRTVRAVGRVRLDTALADLEPMMIWLQTNADLRPDLLRLRPEGSGPGSVTAIREDDRVRVRLSTSRGEQFRELMAPEGLVFLDVRVAHHWFLALRQHAGALAEGGVVRVPAVLPTGPAQVDLEIRRTGREPLETADRTVQAARHEVSGEVSAVVWVDAEGRVLRLRLPEAKLTVERTE